MREYNLTRYEINDLIRKYQSELRKLEFQVAKTRVTIRELLEELARLEESGEGLRHSDYSPVELPTEPEPEPEPKPKRKRRRKKVEKPVEEAVSETGLAPTEETKAPEEKKTRKPRTRNRKKGGYRLSEWDDFILNALKEEQKILVSSDFLDKGKEWQTTQEEPMEDEQLIKGKIARSIHKLANKRGQIVKVDYPGKGFAYALPDWVTKSGNLKKKYIK